MLNETLRSTCILILGGERITVTVVAALLAKQGAIVFLSAHDRKELKLRSDAIRQQVPEGDVIGTVADHTNAKDISRFFLDAAIALPKHDALICFPTGVNDHNFITAADRLFASMMNRKEGHIINVGYGNVVGRPANNPAELCKIMRERLTPFGIKVTELNAQCALNDPYAEDIASVILYLLKQPKSADITNIVLRR